MRGQTIIRLALLASLLTCPLAAHGAVLEVPANGGHASGIGFIAGWKCPPNGNVSVTIDGGDPLPVATGIARGDTAAVCGNDGRNGYITQFNFNLLGDGNHTIVVRQNGVPFAQGTFSVVTLGQSFLRGASGTYVLNDFPQAGQSTTVAWSEGAQNFLVVGRSGGGTPGTGLAGLVGTWDFRFTIISTFTRRYFLDHVEEVLGIPTLVGEGALGELIIVTRLDDIDPDSGLPYEYIALAQGLLSCDGYVFNRTSETTVSGLHTQAFLVDGECGTFFGENPMTGTRISTSAGLDAPPAAATSSDADVAMGEALAGPPASGELARALGALGSALGAH